jgi:hypothetical protein
MANIVGRGPFPASPALHAADVPLTAGFQTSISLSFDTRAHPQEVSSMAFLRRHLKPIVLATSCAAIGAGASVIATAGAAGTGSQAARTQSKHARLGVRRALGRAVHGDLVLATRTGFANATFDRGFVLSVNGQQLTLREGTRRATYKTLTLTIPASARVRDNGRRAKLGQLKQGQRALVLHGPKQAVVIARDARTG